MLKNVQSCHVSNYFYFSEPEPPAQEQQYREAELVVFDNCKWGIGNKKQLLLLYVSKFVCVCFPTDPAFYGNFSGMINTSLVHVSSILLE